MKHLFLNFGKDSKFLFFNDFSSTAQTALGMGMAALCGQCLFFMTGKKRPQEALLTVNKKRLWQTSYSGQPARKPKTFLFILFNVFQGFMLGQNQVIDTTKISSLDEIVVQSTRAKGKNPITYTNVSKEELAPRNLGQDIPVLLNYLPSVISSTDAGHGIGYTSMRVRGSDGSRINITLNGIPFNDSESQATFFVNLPDFASSLESIQLQRGIGTSTNGPAAFGASLNMQMKSYHEKAFGEISTGLGSFGTQRHHFAFSTGLDKNIEINARISKIISDGYIDRATANMFGYFLNANYVKEKSIFKFYAFGGHEKTYQAWNGNDETINTLLSSTNSFYNFNRTFNTSGLKMDKNGVIEGFHNNEIDNYAQHHFQGHWTQNWSDKWFSNFALHYTKGKGFFEQYVDDYYYSNVLFRNDATLSFLGLPNIIIGGETIESMDYIRRRWLDNDFYGATFSLNYKTKKTDVLIGGAANQYRGLHYGEVIWNQYNLSNIGRYYDNFGNKDEVNVFTKITQDLLSNLSLFVDLQYRYVHYKATSFRFEDVNDTFRFFNPKIGLDYKLNNKNTFYAFGGITHREPRRDDYENNATQFEQLQDIELGWRFLDDKFRLNANTFFMNYKNQLVLTGAINDVGSPVFANSGSSYRLGLEVDATIKLHDKISWLANFTYSRNKNRNFYFERDGVLQNLGQTNIAYSPEIIAGSQLQYKITNNFLVNVLSKYVGKQFMGNIDSQTSVLPSYFVNDLNLSYQYLPENLFFKSVTVNLLVNNIFNRLYESNGYFYTYDDDWSNPNQVTTIEGVGFYPQAGRHFLVGVTARF